jgi:membrane-bound lytic murein transglycosylase
LLPPPGQVDITDLQEEKCQEKENGRKQVLASMVDTNWITVALQEKSKQSDVTTMMQQVHNQYQTNVETKTAEAKTTNVSKKRKAKPKKAKEKDTRRPAETVFQETSNTPEVAEETAVRLCGCRHGDLS